MKVRRLLILLFLPALAYSQERYYGTIAAGVQIAEPYKADDLDKILIKKGDTITPENVRASIESLYATGHYRQVLVDAVATPEGTQLTFNVSHHYFFSTIRLKNEHLLARSLSSSLRLPVGEKFSTAVLERLLADTTQLLEDAGYFGAVVTPELQFYPDTRLVTVTLAAATQERARIGSVELRSDEQTFSNAELRDALDLSTGDEYTADLLSEKVARVRKKFTDLGFVNTKVDVTRRYDAARNQIDLDVQVESGQFLYVKPIGFEISQDRLRQLLPSYEEGAFDQDLLKEGTARIAEYLQQEGYFEATVNEPETIEAPRDRAIQLNFVINPGEQYRIRSIEIQGATAFDEDEIKRRMKTREAGIFGRGIFSATLLAEDLTRIETLYRRAGYEDVIVKSRLDDAQKHAVEVFIDIVEGPRRGIASLTFVGNLGLTEDELREASGLKEKDMYSPAAADAARAALMSLYYSKGYADARVDVAADPFENSHDKAVTFQITEGNRYIIGKITVAGNTRTAEKIVLRYSRLKAYEDPYNPEAILEAQQRLYASGLFNRVEIATLDQDTGDQRPLLIQVEDAKPILIKPGVGAREYVGPRVTLDVSHNNLFGLDRAARFRTRLGVHERLGEITYREPHLFNHDLEGFGILSIEKTRQPNLFDIRRFDFSIQVVKRIPSNKSFITTLSYQVVDLQDIKFNTLLRRIPDSDLRGIVHIARVGGQYNADWRDDVVEPQRGASTRMEFQVASKAWGSEVNFVSAFNQSTYFKPVPHGVLGFSSRIGWKIPYGDTTEIPIFERYFAGGSTTLRGFGIDEAGPVGGGQLVTIANAEYRFPMKFVPIGGLKGGLFYDTGNVFEVPSDFSFSGFTNSVGGGLRYQTPVGPVRFDVGINLHPRTFIRTDGFEVKQERVKMFFTLGHAF